MVYLGVIIDSSAFRASPSLPRVKKLFSIVEEFPSCDAQPASSWLTLLGVLSIVNFSGARRSFENEITSAEVSSSLGPQGLLDVNSVGLVLSSGPGMVVGSESS